MLAIWLWTETSRNVGSLAGNGPPIATVSEAPLTSTVAPDVAGVWVPVEPPARTTAKGSRPGKRLNETSWPSRGSGLTSVSGRAPVPPLAGAGVPGAGEGVVVVVPAT